DRVLSENSTSQVARARRLGRILHGTTHPQGWRPTGAQLPWIDHHEAAARGSQRGMFDALGMVHRFGGLDVETRRSGVERLLIELPRPLSELDDWPVVSAQGRSLAVHLVIQNSVITARK